jgi:hypothetical protein
LYNRFLSIARSMTFLKAPTPYLGQMLPSDFYAFGSSCRHRIPVPQSPTLDANSSSKISAMNALATSQGYGHYPTLATSTFGHPAHVVNGTRCPKVDIPVSSWSSGGPPWLDPDTDNVAENIPVPESNLIVPDTSTDHHVIIVDMWQGKVWEMWNFVRVGSGNYTCGMMAGWDIGGLGYNTDGTYGPRNRACAAGVSLIAGAIQYPEFMSGVIRHALTFVTGAGIMRNKFLAPPASNTDGAQVGTTYVEEGSHIQLDPSIDLDAKGLNSSAKIIAKALQDYGAFCVDRATIMLGIKCATYPGYGTNPWTQVSPAPNLNLLSEYDFRFLNVDSASLLP